MYGRCLLLKILVNNMQRLLLPGIALCNAVVLSVSFPDDFPHASPSIL